MKALLAGMALTALWEATGHFFPLSEPHKPPSVGRRIAGYTWGCLGILLGLAVATDARTTGKAATIAAAAGAATVGGYAVDKLLNAWMLRRAYGCHQ